MHVPDTSLGQRCAIGAALAFAVSATLFAIPGEPPHAVQFIHGLSIIAVPILILVAVVSRSLEKEVARAAAPPAAEIGPSDAQLALLMWVSLMSLGIGFSLGGPLIAFAVFMLPTAVGAWWWYGRPRRPLTVPARDIARLSSEGDVALGRLLRQLIPDGSRASIGLVVDALSESHDPAAEAELRRALSAETASAATRRAAASGLARLGPSEHATILALRGCLVSSDRRLASHAERALERAGQL